MAWEGKRSTTKRYYYQTRRSQGRWVREYFGRGERAQQAAAAVVQRRQKRGLERDASQVFERELQIAAAPVAELCGLMDELAHAALVCAGYHRPKRGKWRKRR